MLIAPMDGVKVVSGNVPSSSIGNGSYTIFKFTISISRSIKCHIEIVIIEVILITQEEVEW